MIQLFFLSLFLLAYTFVGYPLILRLIETLRISQDADGPTLGDEALPSATMIIPAYNEEADIRAKLENALQLDYPNLKILVVSDASTDGTDEMVRGYANRGITLIRLEKRGGKIAAYKNAVKHATGDILIFSDATSHLERESLGFLLRNFDDPKVGCVAGRLFFVSRESADIGKGEEAYWNYNIRIKQAESRLASLTSVSGTFFAVRKHLFPTDIPSDLAEDLIVPLNVRRMGYRTVLELRATCHEASVHLDEQEVRKRARITLQNIRGLIYGKDLLNIFHYGLFSLLLISHKVLRILAPILLIVAFITNLALYRSSDIFRWLLALQSCFYVAGYLTGLLRQHRPRLANAIYFFCLSNYAVLLGILMYLRGNRMTTWETERA